MGVSIQDFLKRLPFALAMLLIFLVTICSRSGLVLKCGLEDSPARFRKHVLCHEPPGLGMGCGD